MIKRELKFEVVISEDDAGKLHLLAEITKVGHNKDIRTGYLHISQEATPAEIGYVITQATPICLLYFATRESEEQKASFVDITTQTVKNIKNLIGEGTQQ